MSNLSADGADCEKPSRRTLGSSELPEPPTNLKKVLQAPRMVQDPAAHRQRGRGRLALAFLCLACVFLDTHGETGTDEHRCKFLP